MKVVDFVTALGRLPRRRRREIGPCGPGTGRVIAFPARARRTDYADDLASCEGNFFFQYDERGWFEWPTSEIPRRQ